MHTALFGGRLLEILSTVPLWIRFDSLKRQPFKVLEWILGFLCKTSFETFFNLDVAENIFFFHLLFKQEQDYIKDVIEYIFKN